MPINIMDTISLPVNETNPSIDIIICKYCHCSITELKNIKFINPCKCTNPIYTKCFLTSLKFKYRTKCEICNEDYNFHNISFPCITLKYLNIRKTCRGCLTISCIIMSTAFIFIIIGLLVVGIILLDAWINGDI